MNIDQILVMVEKTGILKDCRIFREGELTEKYPEKWATNDSGEIDRAIKSEFNLDYWARAYMPKELENEAFNMLCANMDNKDAQGMYDEFFENHSGSNLRLIIPLREGVRLKHPINLESDAVKSDLIVDPGFYYQLSMFVHSVRRSLKK